MEFEPRPEAEILAVEDCCLEWMRLLPVLLPPAPPGQPAPVPAAAGQQAGAVPLGAGAFFREPGTPGERPCILLLLRASVPFWRAWGLGSSALRLDGRSSCVPLKPRASAPRRP